ncbi:MAG TPA: O-antigen ligase family protein [Clostridia bacterium]|nr:O-antigen ligase family protein [Clostridia bacterium]
MKDSLILGTMINICRRLIEYSEYSAFFRVLNRIRKSFGNYGANSRILGFFNREWNIAGLWKRSLVLKALISPLRLLGYVSGRLSDGTNSALEGSSTLGCLKAVLEELYNMNIRVYGLLFLTSAAVRSLLGTVSGNMASTDGMGGTLSMALLLSGTVMILINRPVKALVQGSIVGRLAYDFFTVSGDIPFDRLEHSKRGRLMLRNYVRLELAAAIAGIILGILGYFLEPRVFIMALGGVLGSIFVLWRYEIGIYAVVGLIPLAPTMALLGLILLTAVSYVIRLFLNKSMSFRVTILDYFVVLFGIVLFYSSITSYTPGSSILSLSIYAACILFYFILVNTVKTRQQLYALLALLVLSTTLTSLYGLYQLRTVGATSEAWVDTTLFEDIKARVGSTFENPNVLGEYLVLIIPVAIAMLWGQRGWISRLLTLGLTAIMLVCLVYTYSRGAYIGLMLAFALFAVLRDRRFVVLGVIGLMLLPFVLPPSVINRFTSIGNLSDTSSNYRISVWLGSLKLAGDYWPSGIGLGLEPFKLIYPKYSLNAAYAHHSHNIYIQLLIETGIAGFLTVFAMVAVYYKTLLAGFFKTRDRFISTFMIAAASGMAGYLAQGMVENIWYNNRVLLTFWVMLALGMIAKGIISKDNEVLDI